jgi:hypothetical protein
MRDKIIISIIVLACFGVIVYNVYASIEQLVAAEELHETYH